MVDGDQRLVGGHGQRLGGNQPDHYPANQPRPGGGGHGIDIGEGEASIGERGGNQRGKALNMGAGGDLGHHSAIRAVGLVLRGNVLREDHPSVGHHCRGGFVARRFDAQNLRQKSPRAFSSQVESPDDRKMRRCNILEPFIRSGKIGKRPSPRQTKLGLSLNDIAR